MKLKSFLKEDVYKNWFSNGPTIKVRRNEEMDMV